MRTLLVIDDDRGMTAAMSTRLASLGYRVLTSASGSDGLAQFAANDVDAVLTDLEMPGLSGVDVAAEIRRTSDVPIIVLSGRKPDFKRELRAVSDVIDLTKPCETDDLVSVLNSVMQEQIAEVRRDIPA